MSDETLRDFARKVIEAGWDGDVDGSDVQDWAVLAGLLVPTEMTEACGALWRGSGPAGVSR